MNRMHDSPATRRDLLRLFAAGAALTFARPARAGERRVDKLITQAQVFPAVSERIGYISAALRGTRYRADTLIGGPRRKEEFVVRDDAFDCVTYIEAVLAAANARKPDDYDGLLRKIRYRDGVVAWHERNHYFFDWCRRNVENGLCGWLDVEGEVAIKKTCDSQRGLETRRFTMPVIPRAAFLDNKDMLRTGDIIGFVSRRPDLDYFHTGLIAFDNKGALLLRHASEHARRVLDESMRGFLARWNVRYVTLVRPQERKPVG
jgi:N-acetylmuramoyl-L-alanine amidase-like